MGEFPDNPALPLTIWTGDARHGIGAGSRAIMAGSGGFSSVGWTTANQAIYAPIVVPYPYPVRNMFVYNYATVAGNCDVGIYNDDLTLIVSAGSTVQAGASALQFFAVDLTLNPGCYYLGLSSNSTTATFAAMVSGTATRHRYLGILQQATAFPLPATITPVAIAVARIPAIGLTWVSGTPTF